MFGTVAWLMLVGCLIFALAAVAVAAEEDFALPGGGSIHMIQVPAGPFFMGNDGREPYVNPDETPQHEVFLSSYWIGKFEVTRGQYRRFIDSGGYNDPRYWSKDGWAWKSTRKQPAMWDPKQAWSVEFVQTDDHPVTSVSWYEAEAFCNWAGLKLPTEAQWEKAARWDGRRSRIFPWGDKWDPERCNCWEDNLYQDYQTAPVGSYLSGASPYGLMDMGGNVWEWCRDRYSPGYYSHTPKGGWIDPEGPPTGACRAMRGGSWFYFDYNVRCAYRGGYFQPSNWYYEYGFRVVKEDASSNPFWLDKAPVHSSSRAAVTIRPKPKHASSKGIGAYKGTDPIGGGSGYTEIIDKSTATAVVSSADDFKKAVSEAKPGAIIYIADGAKIDLSGETTPLVLPAQITIAGNRGRNGSPGPTIFTTHLDRHPVITTGGPGIRVAGIRFQGPDTEIRSSGEDNVHIAVGIIVNHPDVEFANCEATAWNTTAIQYSDAGKGGGVHHCHIHHNRGAGYGYGVYVHNSQVDITANHFAENRHDVAGSGRAGSSYRARYNISEASEPFTSHAFDMHGNQNSRAPGEIVENIAGDQIEIAYNTFRSFRPRIYIAVRGRPRQGLTVHDNVFENAYIGGTFLRPCSNAVVYDNHFSVPPKRASYTFDVDGNIVDGKRAKPGETR